jgi:hypothetical protein
LNGFQDGCAGQHQIGAIAAYARLLFAAVAAEVEQVLDDRLAMTMLHP